MAGRLVPSFRNDEEYGMDIGDAYVFEELKEMSSIAQEQRKPLPPDPPTQTIALSNVRQPSLRSSRSSRSNSRSSQQDERTKMKIHKDEPNVQEHRRDAHKNSGRSDLMESRPASFARNSKHAVNNSPHSRSKSDSMIDSRNISYPNISSNANHLESGFENTERDASWIVTTRYPESDLVQQLQVVSKKREALLEQLQDLNAKEMSLLREMAELESSRRPSPDYAFKNEHQVSGSHKRTASDAKRVPLADKTPESLAAWKSTSVSVHVGDESSSGMRNDMEASIAGLYSGPNKSKIYRHVKTVQVPTKFGDEEGSIEDGRRQGRRPGTPRGGPSKAEKHAFVDCPQPVTPRLRKSYEVPNTVIRKSWDF